MPFRKDITHRPKEAEERLESGKKLGTAGLLTLVERKHRSTLIFKLRAQTQKEVHRVLDNLEKQLGTEDFSNTFKTITVDNGTEFLDSETLEKSIKESSKPRTHIYYCHPYAFYGSVAKSQKGH